MQHEFELIPGHFIGGSHPCFIIAEIGQNHQGDVRIAKEMIKIAKECGVDCVKFQKSNLTEKFCCSALERPYDSPHSWGKTYGEHKRHLELTEANFRELKNFADNIGVAFTASGMDKVSMDFLDHLGVPFFKIGSGDTNNLPLVLHTAKKQRPLVISSGMQTLDTMKHIYHLVHPINRNFCFMQCTSAYPLNAKDAHLRVIQTYQKEFPDIPIGYSGHETGITISTAAVALGAKVLERHFTLNKTWKGSDHQSSLEPSELLNLIKEIRIVEDSLGNPNKQFLPCELPCYNKLGKSIVAAKPILRGQRIISDMMTVKVSDIKGCKPEKWESLINKVARRNIARDDPIMEDDIEN